MTRERNGWETTSSQSHFQNDHLAVTTDHVRSPARNQPRPWTVVHRKRAVAIAPMTPEGGIVLIRQERIPIRTAIWEVPAGQIDQPGNVSRNTIEEVALRELHEETGYKLAPGGELIALGDFFTSPGLTNEQVYLFLARPVQASAGGPAHDEWESIVECRVFTPDELLGMIDRNEICNGNTLAICSHLFARGILASQNRIRVD